MRKNANSQIKIDVYDQVKKGPSLRVVKKHQSNLIIKSPESYVVARMRFVNLARLNCSPHYMNQKMLRKLYWMNFGLKLCKKNLNNLSVIMFVHYFLGQIILILLVLNGFSRIN